MSPQKLDFKYLGSLPAGFQYQIFQLGEILRVVGASVTGSSGVIIFDIDQHGKMERL